MCSLVFNLSIFTIIFILLTHVRQHHSVVSVYKKGLYSSVQDDNKSVRHVFSVCLQME